MKNDWEILDRHLSEPPVKIPQLASDLGLTYVERYAPDENSGGIDFDGWQYVVWVNAEESPQRKRFTGAHEIAHYLLHRDLLKEKGHMDRLFDSTAYDNPNDPFTKLQEVEANKYAAAILMPKTALVREIDGGITNVRGLAKKFNVSALAMKYRLKNLNLGGWRDDS